VTTLAPARPAFTAVEHFAWWAETHCVQSVDQFAGRPLVLEDWQREFMGEALAVDEDERPFWASVVLVLPRKNGKTTMLAAYATYHLLEDEGSPEVLLAASSDKQAGRLFDGVCAFARRSSYIRERVHLREYIGEIARVDGMGKVLRMASDPNRAHGYNPSRVVIDELHAWRAPSLRKAWAAFTTAGGARSNTQVLVISTAGEAHEREESILGRLVDANEAHGETERRGALTISRDYDARVLVYNFSAPVGRVRDQSAARHDFAAIRAANPAGWVTDDYLRRQIANPELSDAECLQLHGCVWADSGETFVNLDAWDALADGAPVADGREVFLGIDGSLRYDTTVVAWAAPAADGRIDVECRIWSARRDAPHHVFCPGEVIDFEAVEEDVVERFGRFDVREAAYDPTYLARSAQILSVRLGDPAIAAVAPASTLMRQALGAFHRGIIDGVVRHTGDSDVRAHMAATKARQDERGWRVDKRLHRKPIDAVIAMALAYWRASLQVDAPASYVFRGSR
jgi:phage terminase large subunit-like protein